MEPDIGSKSRFVPTPPAFDTRGYRRTIVMTFNVEKTRMVWIPDDEKMEDRGL